MGALDIVVLVLVCVAFAGAAGWLIFVSFSHLTLPAVLRGVSFVVCWLVGELVSVSV